MSGAETISTETLTGRIKWYDAVKGYGFVAIDDDGGDVLLHANCLRRSEVDEAPEGAQIILDAVAGERGRQAVLVREISNDFSESAVVEPQPTQIIAVSEDASDWFPARVKWFDRAKGFGFLNIFGDKSDVFVHMETLRAANLTSLEAGEAVATKVTDGPRGKMATEVTLWESIEIESSED